MTESLFDRFRRKVVDRRGDSMVEALVAILIAVLGATMLATMVMASASTAIQSERALDASYDAESNLMNSHVDLTKVKVYIPNSEGANDPEPAVTLYGSGDYERYCEGKRA
ncbi:hypothetical protein [Paraeggerthella sp. Marseille-Q4926]|uniref:type IV pilus modification PilV family protein n=1 Tax=unclassified Paraeggerthella TaxID=2641972 RepID=UPI001CE4123A|nr:hypothetical protein [Paraeggerthella sp. Marseille-Q4926]MDY3981161.1 hypothetical protein [Paraeggerthella sp.]